MLNVPVVDRAAGKQTTGRGALPADPQERDMGVGVGERVGDGTGGEKGNTGEGENRIEEVGMEWNPGGLR